MNKKQLKATLTSRKISEKLHKLDFKMPTSYYWIKTPTDDRFSLQEIKGRFFNLRTTKVYPAYPIGTFLTILEQVDYDFKLTRTSLVVANHYYFDRAKGTLVDLLASAIITLIESKQIIAE